MPEVKNGKDLMDLPEKLRPEVERLFGLLKVDDAINSILIPKLVDFSELENIDTGDNA